MNQPRVLFHIASYPACNEMFVIIDHMLETIDVEIFVFVENEKISQCITESFSGRNIQLIDFYANEDKTESKLQDKKHIKSGQVTQYDWWLMIRSRLKIAIYEMPVFEWHRQKTLSELIRKRVDKCKVIIAEVQPSCIVVRGDRHFGNLWEGAFLKVCGENKIKRVIIPIATSSTESLIKMREKKKVLFVRNRSKLKKEFENQIILDPQTGNHLLYKKAYVLRALKENEILSGNPWVMGGGNSDVMMVEGDASYRRYSREGTPVEKMVITGHGSNDKLYSVYGNRKTLHQLNCEKYSFDPGKKIIIMALPQLGEHKLMSWENHWSEIHFLCQTLLKVEANILISLHPRMDPEKYVFIQRDYNFQIATDRLVDILPIANIFLSAFSSTLEWSMMCSIPTVAFDFYNLNYKLYDNIVSLMVINEKKYFLESLRKLVNDNVFYLEIKKLTEKDSKKFGRLDGSCRDRIVETIL